jgi:hypothetical protein
MTRDAAARAREGLQQGFLAEPLPQRLASLRACATLLAWDTRPTPPGGSDLRRLSPLFFCIPLEAECLGSGRRLV